MCLQTLVSVVKQSLLQRLSRYAPRLVALSVRTVAWVVFMQIADMEYIDAPHVLHLYYRSPAEDDAEVCTSSQARQAPHNLPKRCPDVLSKSEITTMTIPGSCTCS